MKPDDAAAANSILAKALTKPYVGPFPNFPRPYADECRAVKAALEKLHGSIERLQGPETNELQVSTPEFAGVVDSKPDINGGQEVSSIGKGPLILGAVKTASALAGIIVKTEENRGVSTPELQQRRRSLPRNDRPDQQENPTKKVNSEPSPGYPDHPPTVKEEHEDLGLGANLLSASHYKHNEGESLPGGRSAKGHCQSGVILPPSTQARRLSLRSHSKHSQTGSPKTSTELFADRTAHSPKSSSSKKLRGKKRKLKDDPEGMSCAAAPVTPDQLEAGSKQRKAVELHCPQKLELSLFSSPELKAPQTPTSLSSVATQSQLLHSSAAGASPLSEQTASYSTRRTVLDSLVSTILSQNTTDKNSHRAFASLKAAFPTWEDVRAAGQGPLAASIKSGGLAEIKARRILDILDSLHATHGPLELEHLRYMSDEQVKAELSRFKGVGPKTVACVLMFCLDRHEFPVDTHVWRISKRLGWVPANADREATYEHLNQRVPDDVKYDLHCLLVGHGKKCPGCAKGGRPQRAPDGPCPLGPWIRATG